MGQSAGWNLRQSGLKNAPFKMQGLQDPIAGRKLVSLTTTVNESALSSVELFCLGSLGVHGQEHFTLTYLQER